MKPIVNVVGIWCLGLPLTAGAVDWPQWRGPDRTDISAETGLMKSWTGAGPKRVWLYREAGHGYSGPSIAGGKLFTMGTREGREILLALDANEGKELWATEIGKVLKNNWGDGPRGTPSVDGDRVYTLSGSGDLLCAGVSDGKAIWRATMSGLGGSVPGWGYTESVLVDGDRVICTPGGSRGTLAALDKATGKVLWQSKSFTDPAHYSSVIVAEHAGVRQYIQLTERRVAGIKASDGSLLWKSEWPGRTAVIPTPMYHDNHVYVTSGYGAGCKLIQLGSDQTANEVYQNKIIENHHGGVIRVGDYVYGHSNEGGWTCQNFKTGEVVWQHRGFGKGALTCADGMFYCLDQDSGTVALVELTPSGWSEKGRFKLDPQTTIRNPQGRIWTHPVVSGGKLYLRDQDLVYCYDIKG